MEATAADAGAGRPAQLVEHFFRHETGRLHGVLVRMLGVENLALAEDVAQEALLRALRVWAIGGVPPNPSAWITQVAKNLALDALRHRRMAQSKEDGVARHFEQQRPDAGVAEEGSGIRDDTLRLLFVCCHPALAADAQVVLALKVLGGFGTGEIARAFFASEAAIEKQLTRTKQRIRDLGLGCEVPAGAELAARLDGVLAVLYQLFNEGYKASDGDRLIRQDLTAEAVRLTEMLVAHPAGDAPRSHALLALMLLNAARFPSRLDEEGALLRLRDQDRAKWRGDLIARGMRHLAAAAAGTELSEYHLQAGIAAIHCNAPDYAGTDWPAILRHYDALLRLRPSPVVALNRAVALAEVAGPAAGLAALAAIPGRERLESHYLLHAVAGELHWRQGAHADAARCFRRALEFAQVGPEQRFLGRVLARSEAAGN